MSAKHAALTGSAHRGIRAPAPFLLRYAGRDMMLLLVKQDTVVTPISRGNAADWSEIMTTRHIAAGVIALLVFTTPAGAQARNGQARGQAGTQNRQGQTQFNAQDRQATSAWANQHQAHPPVGFRPQDRLSPTQESRLQVGSKLAPELQKLVHTVPADLRHQFAAPAPSYRYVTVGGHVALLDKQNQVHDVIHVHQ